MHRISVKVANFAVRSLFKPMCSNYQTSRCLSQVPLPIAKGNFGSQSHLRPVFMTTRDCSSVALYKRNFRVCQQDEEKHTANKAVCLDEAISVVTRMPTILTTTVRSLPDRLIDLETLMMRNKVDIACIADLDPNPYYGPHDLKVRGYDVFTEMDNIWREALAPSKVSCYVRSDFKSHQFLELGVPNIGSLWLSVGYPKFEPHGYETLVIGAFNHPSHADSKPLQIHMTACLRNILQYAPQSGVILMGNLGSLKDQRMMRKFCLKQLVDLPTWKDKIDDKIFTNMWTRYQTPIIHPPFCHTDHRVVLCKSLQVDAENFSKLTAEESNTKRLNFNKLFL